MNTPNPARHAAESPDLPAPVEPALCRPAGLPPAGVVLLVVIAASAFCNLFLLGDPPLSRTEPHRALVGHQMLERGEWIVPHLYGQVYLRKPPGMAWAIALAEKLAGRGDEFIWRLPSALGAVLLAVWIWATSRRWFGELGAAAGAMACVGMVALWPQSRSADIDSLNTLATLVTAGALFELGFGPGGRRWLWGGAALAGSAAMLLLKGPTGLPVVLGVMIGSSAATRSWRWLGRPAVWVSLIGGAAVFAAWVVAVKLRLEAMHAPVDSRGVQELIERMTDITAVFAALALPAVMAALSLPWSAALVGVTAIGGGDVAPREEAEMRTLRRRGVAAAGAAIGSAAVFLVTLTWKERYAYVELPLVCWAVAAVAEAWGRGWLSARAEARLRQVMTAAVLGMIGWQLVAVFYAPRGPWRSIVQGSAVLAISGGIRALAGWYTLEYRRAMWGTAAVIVALAVAFNYAKNAERRDHSCQRSGAVVKAMVKPGEAVVADGVARDQPELFWYAGLDVQRPAGGIGEAAAGPGGVWLVLSGAEWQAWSDRLGDRLSRVQSLKMPPGAVVAWLEPRR